MSVLKWLLIVLGLLVLLSIVAIVGGFYWASTVESVKLTAADVEVGGAYPPEERNALLAACTKAAAAEQCTCVADRAGTEFSRFERLILTASFEGSPTKIVAITKGLIESGIPQEKVEAMEAGTSGRIDSLMQACGLKR